MASIKVGKTFKHRDTLHLARVEEIELIYDPFDGPSWKSVITFDTGLMDGAKVQQYIDSGLLIDVTDDLVNCPRCGVVEAEGKLDVTGIVATCGICGQEVERS